MAKSKQYSVFMRNILLSRRLCLDSFPKQKLYWHEFPTAIEDGSQTTSGEMANKTGLLCSVDDSPYLYRKAFRISKISKQARNLSINTHSINPISSECQCLKRLAAPLRLQN